MLSIKYKFNLSNLIFIEIDSIINNIFLVKKKYFMNIFSKFTIKDGHREKKQLIIETIFKIP